MAIRQIIKFPEDEEFLRKPCTEITSFDAATKQMVLDMKETILSQPAVGLAAPQIGINKRIIALRLGQGKDGKAELNAPLIFINPKIKFENNIVVDYDGCLSIPELYGFTSRPHELVITGYNENGRRISRKLFDLDARVAHHEVDHLDGVLFLDRIKNPNRSLYALKEVEDGFVDFVPYAEFRSYLEPINSHLYERLGMMYKSVRTRFFYQTSPKVSSEA